MRRGNYRGPNSSYFFTKTIEKITSNVYAPIFDDPIVSYKPKSEKHEKGPITWASLNLDSKKPVEKEKEKEKEKESKEQDGVKEVVEETKEASETVEEVETEKHKPGNKKGRYRHFQKPKVMYVRKTPQSNKETQSKTE